MNRQAIVWAIASSSLLGWSARAIAQILPDNTLATENSVVVPLDPFTDAINGGAIRGSNLFHSFQDFNVGEGRTVNFSNPAAIETILTRITGSNPSNIFGTLGVLGNANLFLLNPNGIVFGSNAHLNLNGSFFATTAESLNFADGYQFSATNPDSPPLLTINVPIGLQFGATPGNLLVQTAEIESNTGLDVLPGNSLTFVGGDVTFDGGNANAPGGRLELGGLSAAGTVGLTVEGHTNHLNFPENAPLSNVTLANDARVSVRSIGGGEIRVRANRFLMTEGGRLVAGTEGAGDGGDITVEAIESVELVDGAIESLAVESATGDAGNISIITGTYQASGKDGYLWSGTFNGGRNAGNIYLDADSVDLSDGSSIDASNRFGSGNAGNVEINGRNEIRLSGESFIDAQSSDRGNGGNVTLRGDRISLDNSDIFSSVLFGSTGRAGDIEIQSASLALTDGSNVTAFGSEGASAGDITVQGTEFVTLDNGSEISGFASGRGTGGSIAIATARLSILNGSSLFASVLGDRSAGRITVNATESIDVSGSRESSLGGFTGSKIAIDTTGTGNAGTLTLNTGRLIVRDGATVSTSSLGSSGHGGQLEVNATESVEVTGTTPDGLTPSTLGTNTAGAGAAGTVQITTNQLMVRGGGRVSAFTTSSGRGGNLEVNASESVEVSGYRPGQSFPSSLDVASGGTGDAGNLRITTGQLTIEDGGQIIASTSGYGRGGHLDVNSESVEVVGFSSQLTTQTFGEQPAGDLTITTDRLSLRDRGRITVSSLGTGSAGTLEIQANSISLEDGAALVGNTTGGQGNLNVSAENLILRRNSRIRTDALGTATGGNINIDAAAIAALENSDISANAEDAFGGQVTIETQGLFGTAFRETTTPNSDITATSERGLQFSGTVTINLPDIDPTSGLLNLPESPVDADSLMGKDFCSRRGTSEFYVTGRGGIPPSPFDPPGGSYPIELDWVEAPENPAPDDSSSEVPSPSPPSLPIEAQGWIVGKQGQIILTAEPYRGVPHPPAFSSSDCQDWRSNR